MGNMQQGRYLWGLVGIGQLCGMGGGLFHSQHKKIEGEKSKKAASKGPSPALVAERRVFMAVLDTQWSAEAGAHKLSDIAVLV